MIQPGLRIYCADREKTCRMRASGLPRSDFHGRMRNSSAPAELLHYEVSA